MSKKPQVFDESGKGRRLCHACGKYTGSAVATTCAACGEPFATRAPAQKRKYRKDYYRYRNKRIVAALAAAPDAVPVSEKGVPLWFATPRATYKKCPGCRVYVGARTRVCPKCGANIPKKKRENPSAVPKVATNAGVSANGTAARQPALGVDVLVAQRALAVVNARIARMGGEKAVSRAVSEVTQLAELCGGLDTLQEFLRISQK